MPVGVVCSKKLVWQKDRNSRLKKLGDPNIEKFEKKVFGYHFLKKKKRTQGLFQK